MGALAPISSNQLSKWQRFAKTWAVLLQARETETGHRLGAGITQWHLTCATCTQTVTVAHDGANPYVLTERLIEDDIVRHLRQNHLDIEASVYAVPMGAM